MRELGQRGLQPVEIGHRGADPDACAHRTGKIDRAAGMQPRSHLPALAGIDAEQVADQQMGAEASMAHADAMLTAEGGRDEAVMAPLEVETGDTDVISLTLP